MNSFTESHLEGPKASLLMSRSLCVRGAALLRVVLFPLLLLLCSPLFSVEAHEIDATARFFDLDPAQVREAAAEIRKLVPTADSLNIAEVGPDGVALSHHDILPTVAQLEAVLGDPKVGGHFAQETLTALPESPAADDTRPSYLPKASWRIKFIISRFVANGVIAAALIMLKDHVQGVDFEWGRIAANAAVHGSVNAFFQTYGGAVADLSYADWEKMHFFPNYKMRLAGLLFRTFFNSWPKRILCTIASVMIYRLTDFAFTGNFEFSLATFAGITMNILAALAPAALGLEMAGRMGPPEAEGLEPRNNRIFDIQNFVISVLFAAGLAANSEEMNKTFGIRGVWAPLYATIGLGGVAWWGSNSRFTNPELEPPKNFVSRVVKNTLHACVRMLTGKSR